MSSESKSDWQMKPRERKIEENSSNSLFMEDMIYTYQNKMSKQSRCSIVVIASAL